MTCIVNAPMLHEQEVPVWVAIRITRGSVVDDSMKWERYGALAGIVAVALIVASAVVTGPPPKASDSAEKILKYFRDNEGGIKASAFLGGLVTIPILWWAGHLWAKLRRAERGRPRLTVAAVLGLLVAGASQAVAGAITATVALDIKNVGPAEAKFFFLLSLGVGAAGVSGLAVLVLATSVVVLRTRVFPVWLGWLGLVLSVALIVSGASIASTSDGLAAVGLVAILVWALWVIILSVLMFSAAEPEPEPMVASSAL